MGRVGIFDFQKDARSIKQASQTPQVLKKGLPAETQCEDSWQTGEAC